VIRHFEPDVVALQELDTNQRRSGQVDQARMIAELLEMTCFYHPAWNVAEEQQGDAILSRLPMSLVHAQRLPTDSRRRSLRPRGALWVQIMVGSVPVHVINTHLDIFPSQQWHQVHALLGPQWLDHPTCHGPIVLCGDFNFGPSSRSFRRLAVQLHDVQGLLNDHRPRSTWGIAGMKRRIDHVFVSAHLHPRLIQIPRTRLTINASDHLPLVVDLQLVTHHQQPHTMLSPREAVR
jgi:endonuclease/exonuclease/phosphatase family metal-dependent hydrolase